MLVKGATDSKSLPGALLVRIYTPVGCHWQRSRCALPLQCVKRTVKRVLKINKSNVRDGAFGISEEKMSEWLFHDHLCRWRFLLLPAMACTLKSCQQRRALSRWKHYGDVIMGAIASQITSLTIVYSAVYSGAHQRKTPKLTGLCVGNSPGTGEFPAQMASNAENVSIWWCHHG